MTKKTVTPPLCLSVENTVSQRRKVRFVVTLLVCLFAVPMRLPAPISEITTPTPAARATKAPQRKTLFAGTWKGSTTNRCDDGSSAVVGPYTMIVSDDERSLRAHRGSESLWGDKTACKRSGNTLNWSWYTATWKTNFSLTLKGASSAMFTASRSYNDAKCRETGTFKR
jgi:hypothetical protein